MKRRTADCGKIRRPIKRNKITESMHSNTFLYMKFLILWAIVIIADFMLEFRFEFLWPFWLLLRSVHDSFKYKGLAFSVLFVCIAITSDLICLFFIPVHWLFFAASTYVWVQYVWHTDKGICLPTIILWMLFVYLEAAIRWKDSRHMPHLDLCRPFAAHCIGYPVVSLGFGFKSYVGHLMRIRKQREVAKENEFYMQLLQQALPQIPATTDEQQSTVCLPDDETTAKDQTTINNGAGIQTLNGDISCGGVVGSSSGSSLVGGLSALTGELIRDLIATASSLMSGATQHFSERAFRSTNNNNNNAQTTTTTSSSGSGSSSNKVLSLGTAGSNSTASSATGTSNGHAVSVQNGGASLQANNSHNNNNHQKEGKVQCNNSSGNNNNNNAVSSSNGGVRKQSHNGAGGGMSEKEKEATGNKCDFKGSSSYHATTTTPGNGATAILSAAIMLSTAASGGGTETGKQGTVARDKDYASMNGSGSASSGTSSTTTAKGGGGGGNEYHQQQNHHQSKENNNNRLANNQSSSSSHQNGTHYAHTADQKSTSGDSTNHNTTLASASSSPLSSSCCSSESVVASSGKQQHQRMNGQDNGTEVVVNGNGPAEKTKGKKNRSKQKQEAEHQLMMMQICTSCSRLEQEVRRLKVDVSHVKQIENELKQRTDTNANLKANLQAKNKEAEELDKKVHELTVIKQSDRQMLNSLEQRLGYEQRQRKQLETLLGNERKVRIKAEEKAAKCYTEIASIDEKKKSAELQNRSYEVEMRKMENELRNRDSEEVLLTALQSMQEKNRSLEKSLSCETRFKLDLFSALGEARRQIELKDGLIGKQMDEITDLKAKIAQLVAIMPIMPISPSRPDNVGYHHTSPGNVVVSSSSMMRLSNGSPLMVNSNQQQQDMNNNANERSMMGQSPQQQQSMFMHQMAQQQQQQQQSSSTLDPNARSYTPVMNADGSV